MPNLTWAEVADAAAEISWVTNVGTTCPDGTPHVAVVAPGLDREGEVWFATRRETVKHRNLLINPGIAFHWPVITGSGPGELFARGTATIHDSEAARTELWNQVVPYDLSGFFGSSENPDVLFVQAHLSYASLLGPDFIRRIWQSSES